MDKDISEAAFDTEHAKVRSRFEWRRYTKNVFILHVKVDLATDSAVRAGALDFPIGLDHFELRSSKVCMPQVYPSNIKSDNPGLILEPSSLLLGAFGACEIGAISTIKNSISHFDSSRCAPVHEQARALLFSTKSPWKQKIGCGFHHNLSLFQTQMLLRLGYCLGCCRVEIFKQCRNVAWIALDDRGEGISNRPSNTSPG